MPNCKTLKSQYYRYDAQDVLDIWFDTKLALEEASDILNLFGFLQNTLGIDHNVFHSGLDKKIVIMSR